MLEIPAGRDHATSIPALARATGLSDLDRVIRTARSRALGNLRRARAYRLCKEAMRWSPELFPGAR